MPWEMVGGTQCRVKENADSSGPKGEYSITDSQLYQLTLYISLDYGGLWLL